MKHQGTILRAIEALEVVGLAYALEVKRSGEDSDGTISKMVDESLKDLRALVDDVPDAL